MRAEPFDLEKFAAFVGIDSKLCRYYISLIDSWDSFDGEAQQAQQAAQQEQSYEAFTCQMIRKLEEHRKACGINLP
jgi:hypothetical protein